MNASAAVLIINAEFAVSVECSCESLIGNTRDSNRDPKDGNTRDAEGGMHELAPPVGGFRRLISFSFESQWGSRKVETRLFYA